MDSAARTRGPAAAGQEALSPVTVDCNRCGYQFLSRAGHGQKVRCPRCKHDIRVKRWAPVASSAAGSAAAPAVAASPPAVSAPPLDEFEDDDEDDDGETYMYDEHGRLVLAEWTEDGRLVPAGRQPAAGAGAGPQSAAMTWAGALAELGWRLEPGTDGCQVRTPDGVCDADATRRITGGWACGRHHAVLCQVISGRP